MYLHKEKKVAVINCTAHRLDFAEVPDGELLSERRVDFSVEVDEPLSVHFHDEVVRWGDVRLYRRRPEGEEELLQKVARLVSQVPEGYTVLVYVSLPTAQAFAQVPGEVWEYYLGKRAKEVFVGAIVSATERYIKPPVARAWAISLV